MNQIKNSQQSLTNTLYHKEDRISGLEDKLYEFGHSESSNKKARNNDPNI